MMGLGGVGVVVCASNNSGAGAAPVWVGWCQVQLPLLPECPNHGWQIILLIIVFPTDFFPEGHVTVLNYFLGALLVPMDWQVRVFGLSGIFDRPSDCLYVSTIPQCGFMEIRSCYTPTNNSSWSIYLNYECHGIGGGDNRVTRITIGFWVPVMSGIPSKSGIQHKLQQSAFPITPISGIVPDPHLL